MTHARRRLAGLGALLWAAAFAFAAPVRAAVVERVVAVVGDHAVLLSDLRARARPYEMRIEGQVPGGAQRAAALSQMYKAVLERMIDEELERKAASRAHVTTSTQEVDEAILRIATQNNVSAEKVVAEAIASGLSEAEYRSELRRQVLEAKVVNLRLQGRIRVTEADARSEYRRMELDERAHLDYRAAWIVVSAHPAAADRQKKEALAASISSLARGGEDFGDLARRYSEDGATRAAGGALTATRRGQLPRAVEVLLRSLEVGEVSAASRLGDDLVIVKLLDREESDLPNFDKAKDELLQRVYVEKMNKVRRHWLDGLRQREHVEIRL